MVSGDPHRVALYSGWDDVVMLGAGAVVARSLSSEGHGNWILLTIAVILRASFTMGGSGGGIAYNREEMGDVLFIVAKVARWLNIDAEEALREANRKFRRRFQKQFPAL